MTRNYIGGAKREPCKVDIGPEFVDISTDQVILNYDVPVGSDWNVFDYVRFDGNHILKTTESEAQGMVYSIRREVGRTQVMVIVHGAMSIVEPTA
jgi:hypothetical protein